MRRFIYLAMFLGVLCATAQQPTQPVFQTTALGPDQNAIYRSFFLSYVGDSKNAINVANTTGAFKGDDMDRNSCLKGFSFIQTSVTHTLSPEIFNGLNIHLVDPRLHKKRDPGDAIRNGESVDNAVAAGFAAGIFTFSEIVFNEAHDRAAFSYSFVCGGLCGHGGTIIFERKDGKWIQSGTRCSNWIS